MSRYPLGQPVTIPVTVQQRNTDGTYSLADAGTISIVVKYANLDGTTTTTGTYASPTHDSTGKYHQDIPAADLTGLGHYQYTVTTTGAGAGVVPGEFDVYDPAEPSLLPLQDAYDALNYLSVSKTAATDAEISQYTATIEASLEAMTGGPLVNRIITERAEFSCDMLTLQVKQRPLVQVNSIVSVPNGATVDISGGLDYDVWTNEVRTKGGWAFSAFSPIATVTYVAGWGTQMPAAFNTAGRIILQSLWETQHGPSARPQMGGADMTMVAGLGFIPPEAAEILSGTLNGLPFRITEVFA